MHALEIKNLHKTYKSGLKALSGIDLTVQEGDFFALLGPNGAGKSTTIGVLSSLVRKTSGDVKIFGVDIDKQAEIAKSMMGIVPQEFNFTLFDKVIDIVACQAGYYGVRKKLAYERAEFYLKKLDLWDKRNVAARMLSGGMKRRLMIARALVHEPRMLILDEPTAGVDIEIRRSMWEFLRDLNQKGTTIILTTHYLEEAETLCRNIAIINHGKIIRNATTKELINELEQETYILDLVDPLKNLPESKDFVLKMLDDVTLEVVKLSHQSISELFALLEKENIQIKSMRNKSNRLEELFFNLTQSHKNE